MAMGGDGPWAIALMWVLTVLTFVFVVLRFVTRHFYVHSVGVDDYVYNFAFILLLMYTIFLTVSATLGFGQNMFDVEDPQDLTDAVFYEAVGQLFAVTGMAVAKWSLGLFLLRIVVKTWHKVVIWGVMLVLMGASISVCFVFMLQCTPPAYLWDRRIPGGFCHINTTPVSFLLCISCVIADFFFAMFPWLFIWELQMNQREKMVILISMSFGVLAGACGIKRTMEVPNLSSQNYLKDTVGLIVWSAAEIAITMICIGIPVCRPMYKKYLQKMTSSGAKYNDGNAHSGSYPLRTIGGSGAQRLGDEEPRDVYASSSGSKLGASSRAYVMGGSGKTDANSSDEEILGPEFRYHQSRPVQGQQRPHANSNGGGGGGIYVTEEYRVSTT